MPDPNEVDDIYTNITAKGDAELADHSGTVLAAVKVTS